VDGKSPVEYLSDEAQKDTVRRVARALLEAPVSSVAEVARTWRESLT